MSEDQRTPEGLAVIVAAQQRQISRLHADQVALQDALTAKKGARQKPADALTLTAIGALLAEPDDVIDWIIDERFSYGSVNLLAGKPKAGKSTLARFLAFCIATGTPFLGHRTISGTVWYLVLEDKRSEVRRHFRTLGATGGESLRFLFGNEPDLMAKLRTAGAARTAALHHRGHVAAAR